MVKKNQVRRPPKTKKEIAFVKALQTAPTATQAVIDAGYNVKDRNSAKVIGSQNLTKLNLGDYFDKAGLTLEKIAETTTHIALNAKKVNQFGSVIGDDYSAQLSAMKYSTDLMGIGRDQGGSVNIQLNALISTKKDDYDI